MERNAVMTKSKWRSGWLSEPDLGEITTLTEELVNRWSGVLAPRSWPERLQLLTEIHEQLLEDIEHFETYCRVSPELIGGLIDSLGEREITSLEQAHIYSNSAREDHRRAAGRWLAEHHRRR